MTNAVESIPDPGGIYSNISGAIVIPGPGLTTTNYLDAGAATNTPAITTRAAACDERVRNLAFRAREPKTSCETGA